VPKMSYGPLPQKKIFVGDQRGFVVWEGDRAGGINRKLEHHGRQRYLAGVGKTARIGLDLTVIGARPAGREEGRLDCPSRKSWRDRIGAAHAAASKGKEASRLALLPFPELSSSIALRVHLILEDRGDAVQTYPCRGSALVVHGAAIAYGPVLLDRAHTLAYPRGQLSPLPIMTPWPSPKTLSSARTTDEAALVAWVERLWCWSESGSRR
jgi:hypothetical protein